MTNDTTLSFTVPGMHCGHCKAAVTEEVERVSGVTRVDVDLDAEVVRVEGSGVDQASVVAAIDEAGYDARAA
jgi:copper chaperone